MINVDTANIGDRLRVESLKVCADMHAMQPKCFRPTPLRELRRVVTLCHRFHNLAAFAASLQRGHA